MTPTAVHCQMNDKKILLPSDYENKYNINLRGERPKSSLNTAQRVFTEYVLTNTNNYYTENLTENELITSNNRKNSNYSSNKPIDSINNLISYQFAGDYREQVFIMLIFMNIICL